MNRYRFVEAEKAQRRNVAKACELLEVSTSAFYEWHRHAPTARQRADEELARRIQSSSTTAGAPTAGSGCTEPCAGRASVSAASGWHASCARRGW